MGTLPLFTLEQTQFTSDDHYTPKWVFDKMKVIFDLDVAAPPGGVQWVPAKKYFTQKEDGLTQVWHGFVWCNPPYSNVEPWVYKMLEHKNGIMLLPLVKSNWSKLLWSKAEYMAKPNQIDRIKFIKDGQEKDIMFDTVFYGWGKKAQMALSNLGKVWN